MANGETSRPSTAGSACSSCSPRTRTGSLPSSWPTGCPRRRAVVYRLVRTLEAHTPGARHAGARYYLGFGLADLARQLQPRLQRVALPLLHRLSIETDSTAILSVADGDHAIVLLTQEPPQSELHLTVREGARHPLDVGADGLAILSGRPESPDDTKQVRKARSQGFAISFGALTRVRWASRPRS